MLFGLLISSTAAFAELEPEVLTTERLSAEPNPHWVWVNDVNFYSLLDCPCRIFVLVDILDEILEQRQPETSGYY